MSVNVVMGFWLVAGGSTTITFPPAFLAMSIIFLVPDPLGNVTNQIRVFVEHLPVVDRTSTTTTPPPVSRTGHLHAPFLCPFPSQPIRPTSIAVD